MKPNYLLIQAMLLAILQCQNLNIVRPKIPNAKRPISGSFAASWLGGFCFNSTKCDTHHLDLWDHESFTIHGLWPNPAATLRYDNFHVRNIQDQQLLDDMNNFWPASSNSNSGRPWYWLWDHEFNKHGKDFVQILQLYQPEQYSHASSQMLQEVFFHEVISFYKNQSLQKIDISRANEVAAPNDDGDLILTKDQLSDILSVSPDQFIVSCIKGKDWLLEIQYCLRIQNDLSITLESCRTIVSNKETPYPTVDTCPGNFRLVGYKTAPASQDRVTA
jgi:ribonuclease I